MSKPTCTRTPVRSGPRLARLLVVLLAAAAPGCRILDAVPRMLFGVFESLPKLRDQASPPAPITGPIRAGAAAVRLSEEDLVGVPLSGYLDRILRGRRDSPRGSLTKEEREERRKARRKKRPHLSSLEHARRRRDSEEKRREIDRILGELRTAYRSLEELVGKPGCSSCGPDEISPESNLLKEHKARAWKTRRDQLEQILAEKQKALDAFLDRWRQEDSPPTRRGAIMFPVNRGMRPNPQGDESIRIKTLTIRAGGRRVAWVSFDTCFVDEVLSRAVQSKLSREGLQVDLLLLSASHTHSGPGAFVRRTGLWLGAGVHSYRFADLIRDRIVESVRRAIVSERDAEIGWSRIPMKGTGLLQTRRPNEDITPDHYSLLRVMRRDVPGTPIAAVILGAVHPTVLDSENKDLLSADVTGAVERELERRLEPLQDPVDPVVAIFFQSAGGEIEPRLEEVCEEPDRTFHRFAEHVAGTAARLFESDAEEVETSPTVDWISRRWHGGIPRLQCARRCRNRRPDGRIVPPEECPDSPRKKITKGLYLPIPFLIPGLLPTTGPVVGLRLGKKTLVTVPVEPTHLFGEKIRKFDFFPDIEMVSLTGGYMQYVATTDQYDRRCGESCSTMYGRRTAVKLWRKLRRLLGDLARRRDGKVVAPPPRPGRWRGYRR